jgi:hypothetical protein
MDRFEQLVLQDAGPAVLASASALRRRTGRSAGNGRFAEAFADRQASLAVVAEEAEGARRAYALFRCQQQVASEIVSVMQIEP